MKLIQFLAPLGHPIGFLWLLNLIGFLVLLKQRKWRGALFLFIMATLIYLGATRPVPAYLLGALERRYAHELPADLPACDAVIVLGGSHRSSKYDPLGVDLTDASDRLTAALELMRLQKAKTLVLGGAGHEAGGKIVTDADLVKTWFDNWHLTATPILSLGINADTHDEALHAQALIKEQKWKKIILVTSAFHMKRAEAVFKKLGIDTVPVPCDFRILGGEDQPFKLFPEVSHLEETTLYLHEAVAGFVYRWRDWL
jgi:uncharacterized SAM-binding protein YcdF (DUF218 family)